MKKSKVVRILYLILFIGIVIFSFYIYIGFKYGTEVSKMGKELYKVKKEWKKNKEKPIDSIGNSVIKTMDSVNNKKQ